MLRSLVGSEMCIRDRSIDLNLKRSSSRTNFTTFTNISCFFHYDLSQSAPGLPPHRLRYLEHRSRGDQVVGVRRALPFPMGWQFSVFSNFCFKWHSFCAFINVSQGFTVHFRHDIEKRDSQLSNSDCDSRRDRTDKPPYVLAQTERVATPVSCTYARYST